MTDYLQHGSRHSAGGSDPIPGIGAATPAGLKWAIHTGVSKTLAANGGSGSAVTTFSGAAPGSSGFYTNATDVFALTSTVISGSTYYGISVQEDGNFMFWPSFETSGATAATSVDFELDYANRPLTVSWFEVPPFAQTIASIARNDQIGASRVALVTASSLGYPTTPMIYKATNYTNTALTGQVNVFAWQLDTNNGTVL